MARFKASNAIVEAFQAASSERAFGIAGNGQGLLRVPGDSRSIFVRVGGNPSNVVAALCDIPGVALNTPVVIERRGAEVRVVEIAKETSEPQRFARHENTERSSPIHVPPSRRRDAVINIPEGDTRWAEINGESLVTSGISAEQPPQPHAIAHTSGAQDPVYVTFDQLLDLKVVATTPPSFQVYAFGGMAVNYTFGRVVRVRPAYIYCPPPTSGVNCYKIIADCTIGTFRAELWRTDLAAGGMSVEFVPDPSNIVVALVFTSSEMPYISQRNIIDLRGITLANANITLPHKLALSDNVHYLGNRLEAYAIEALQDWRLDNIMAPPGATSLEDEIYTIRHMIQAITGELRWYDMPLTSIANILPFIANSDLIVSGFWSFALGQLVLPVTEAFPATGTFGQVAFDGRETRIFDGNRWRSIASGLKPEVVDELPTSDFLELVKPGHAVRIDVHVDGAGYMWEPDFTLIHSFGHVHIIGEVHPPETEIVLANFFVPETTTVYINGLRCQRGIDYIEHYPDTLVMKRVGTSVVIDYIAELV